MADAERRGLRAYICCAGAAAHLAGVVAGHTTLPVLGVPMESGLNGLDSLLSTVQMPRGIPVATFAIGKAGAVNAALFAVAMFAVHDKRLADALAAYRRRSADAVLAESLD
jgi:5-(carboxyamino)imidazole ribonucleotide mutase